MVISVIVFVIDLLTGRAITAFGAKSYRIWAGELHRLFIPTFLHGDLMHIASNLYALYIFGPVTEGVLGTKRFVALYLISGAVGYVVSLLAAPAQLAVGASASIFGLMGYTLHFRLRRLPRQWLSIDSGFLQIFLLNLLIAQVVPNIDQWAHLGGLLGGALAGSLLGFERVVARPRFRRRENAAAAVVLALVLFIGLRPLDTAALLRGFSQPVAQSIESRYAGYFLPYTVTVPTVVWKYLDVAGDWARVGERIDADRYVSLGLVWRWDRGVNYEPGATLRYQMTWRRNGEVVVSDIEDVRSPGTYIQVTPAMLGAAAQGEWSVTITAEGRSLARVRVHVNTR